MKKLHFLILITFIMLMPFASMSSNIIYPNGGESLEPCKKVSVSIFSDRYTDIQAYLYYSVNNGVDWIRVAPRFTLNLQSLNTFDWTPTNLNSSTCLVKVEDIYGNLIDQSDSVFTLVPHPFFVTITSPNGAENWDVSSVHDITWDYVSDSANVDLSYSNNDGSSWVSLGTVANSGVYSWELPTTLSSEYRVRISESACAFDESDTTFSVVPNPYVNVLNPNNNSMLYGGGSEKIVWQKGRLSGDSAVISFSIDSGSTWSYIATVESSLERYYWDVSNDINSTTCIVKISEEFDSSKFDVGGVFEIRESTIMVDVTEHGDTLTSCDRITITLAKNSFKKGYYDLFYSIDNGLNWIVIDDHFLAFSYTCYEACSSPYYWTIPKLESNEVLFKFESEGFPDVSYISPSPIAISHAKNVDLQLTNLLNGETLKTGEIKTLKVNVLNPTGGPIGYTHAYNIDYSVDAGRTWTYGSIKHRIAIDSINWLVPNVSGDSCLVIVRSTQNICTSDTSSFLKIEVQSNIAVEHPSEPGLSLYAHSVETILWRSTNISSGLVDIDYTIDDGASWTRVASSEPDDGSYTWIVPNDISSIALLRIQQAGDGVVFGSSLNHFNIVSSSFEITSPSGGETYTGCEQFASSWNALGAEVTNVYFSSDNGQVWQELSGSILDTTFSGSLPGISSSNCLLMVTNIDSSLVEISESFAVSAPLSITSPNGGEQIGTNTNFNITWDSDSAVNIDNVRIRRTFDGGSSWYTVTSSAANVGEYDWSLFSTTSTQSLVAVTSTADACMTDTSDAYFTLLPIAGIVFNSQDSIYYVGNREFLSLTAKNLTSTDVKMELSTDGGVSWSLVEDAFPTTGSLKPWMVPNTPSTNCIFRFSEMGNPAVFTLSNQFTIASKRYVCTSFTQGEAVHGCTAKTIEWMSYGYPSDAYFYYSIDNGASWEMGAGVRGYSLGDSTMEWLPPQINAPHCIGKIVSSDDLSEHTLLDSSFSLVVTPMELELTSPSGSSGGDWVAGNYETIKWKKSDNIGLVYIRVYDYYTNDYLKSYSSANDSLFSIFVDPDGPAALKVVIFSENSCVTSETRSPIYVDNSGYIKPTYPSKYTSVYENTNISVYFQSGNLPEYSSGYVHIYYSTDSTNWIYAGPSLNGTSYSWDVPNIEADSCILKFLSYDVYDTVAAYSDYFEVKKQSIEVVSPNGGETLYGCSSHRITWVEHTKSSLDSVNIYYSENSGSTWIPIALNKSYTSYWRSYDWDISGINSSSCLIKIEDANDDSIFGVSEMEFTVNSVPGSKITLISHQSSMTKYTTDKDTIRWSTTPDVTNVNIQKSIDGGVTWINMRTNALNSGEYIWTIPNVESNAYGVRVADAKGCAEVSGYSFVVIGKPNIEIYSPSTHVYSSYSTVAISYKGNFLSGDSVKIEYGVQGRNQWELLQHHATNENNGVVYWYLDGTQPVSQSLVVKITDLSDTSLYKISNSFEIENPFFRIDYPLGGEVLTGCSDVDVIWSSFGPHYSQGKYEYSTDSGSTWLRIDSLYGQYSYYYQEPWTLPAVNSSNCKIRFSFSGEVHESDLFTIRNQDATVQVLSPAERDSVKAGEVVNVTWTSTSNVNTVSLYYIDNIRGEKEFIVRNFNNTGAYNWLVDSSLNDMKTSLFVSDDDGCAEDFIETLYVKSSPYLKLNSLNNREQLTSGNRYNIDWVTSGLSTFEQLVDLSYSFNGGVSWVEIERNVSLQSWYVNTYEWQAPVINSDSCLFKIQDSGDSTFYDLSDHFFSIDSIPRLAVISPTTNDNLVGGDSHTILWDPVRFDTEVIISYSLDYGLTWTSIEVNENLDTSNVVAHNDGSYLWTVPDVVAGSALIKVRSNYGYGRSYISEVFTISKLVSVAPVVLGNGDYTLYPNPNKGSFTVVNQSESLIVLLEVYNILGEQIYVEKNTGSFINKHVQLGNAVPGIYLLKLTTIDGSNLIKLVIE